MPLLNDILAQAMTQLYNGLEEETVNPDDSVALTRAAVVRASRRIADEFVDGMVHANARDHIEARLQQRLQQFASTFSENVRRDRRNEIREEFIRKYAGPLHHYLESRMADFAGSLQGQIVIVHRGLETGRLSVDWSYEEIAAIIVLIVALFCAVFYGLVFLPLNLTPEMALSIDVGVLAVLLTAFGLQGKLRMTLPLNERIGVISRNPLIQNRTTGYIDRHRTRFPNIPDISVKSEEKSMTDKVELSSDLLAVSPAEFFTSVFRINRISAMFEEGTDVPYLPQEISRIIFRFMLPSHIYNAMVQLIPGSRLSLQFQSSESDQSDDDDEDGKEDEKHESGPDTD